MSVSFLFGSSPNTDESLGRGCLQPMLIFVKFDSVNRDALWRILGLRGVPLKLIDLMSELYSDTESAVRCGGAISDLFPVVTGVRRGCILTPTLFSACMDWILGRMSLRSSCGASFGNVKISDLDFAETLDILLGGL